MLIRTQNRLQLIIPSSIYAIPTRVPTDDMQSNFYIVYKIMTNYGKDREPDLLGIYDEKETAIQVLDGIQDAIRKKIDIYTMPTRVKGDVEK